MVTNPDDHLDRNQNFDTSALLLLRSHPNWVCYCLEPDGKGRMTKVPYNARNGYKASSTNCDHWSSFEQTMHAHTSKTNASGVKYSGIGYVFDMQVTGIDIDHCIDDEGNISDFAQNILDTLNSYTELSPSHTGLHVFVDGPIPDSIKRKEIEMYDHDRFFTVTGLHYPGTPEAIEVRNREVLRVYKIATSLKEKSEQAAKSYTRNTPPLSLSDYDLLKKARDAKNGLKFSRLYDNGDCSEYADDHSSADQALCNMLAYWTQRDSSRMDSMFRGSALMRDKWDEGRGTQTYGERTIEQAIANCRDVYDPTYRDAPREEKQKTKTPHEETPEQDDSDDDSERGRQTQADSLFAICQTARYYRTNDGIVFGSVPVNGHRKVEVIGEKGGFRKWLLARFYDQYHTFASTTAVQQAIELVHAQAIENAPITTLSTRVGTHDGKIYLDLCNDDYEVVEITPDGWEVIQDSPVHFRRSNGMLPIPTPTRGGNVNDLRNFIKVGGDGDWKMIVSFVMMMLHPTGPYPGLALGGEQGSAKSSATRFIRSLIDPHTAIARAAPKDDRDVAIAAQNNWCIAMENISHIPEWLSDALCSLSTGSGFATRKLYADDEEQIFASKRPWMFNGIGDLVTRGDLLSRTITITMPAMAKSEYKSEKQLNIEYEQARPGILGAFLDATVAALKNLPSVKTTRLGRMADMATWMIAAEPSLGWEEGSFLADYEHNQDDGTEVVISSSQVGKAILALMESQKTSWKGTSTDLDKDLRAQLGQEINLKQWPSNPKTLSDAVKRLTPALRTRDIYVTTGRSGKGRWISIQLGDATGDAGGDAVTQKGDAEGPCVTPASPTHTPSEAKSTQLGDAGDAPAPYSSVGKEEKEEENRDIERWGKPASPASHPRDHDFKMGEWLHSPDGYGQVTYSSSFAVTLDIMNASRDYRGDVAISGLYR